MKKLAIIGLGVIGGSLAMALSPTGKYRITGIDRDPVTLRTGLEIGAVAEATTDVQEGIQGAEIVVLALPVTDILHTAQLMKDWVSPEAVITDVGSTKEATVEALEKLFPGRFVGGHPMTGSEYRGFKGADRYLFENAIYVLTPTRHTSPDALNTVKTIVADTGARLLCLSPKEHDLLVAAVSHLPHLLAVSLMNTALKLTLEHPSTLLLAAGGFRDLTRIASSQSTMWRDIYATNRQNIVTLSRRLRGYLEQMENRLLQGDYASLEREMHRARAERDRIPLKMRGFLAATHEVMVTVPDRPGSIAAISGVTAEAGINIVDLEIVRVREGDGGTIRLAFKTGQEADRARELLLERGFPARRR